ncbi:hypothetical protein [Bradyrhizobium sp. WD16]|uniref:hypothetical protein n=1 Tax=Bradyrhizobium sp. WD16 TaxID=1521768 RepID=UPI0020A43719|nr:hypothetical protein [Bradyrhizobium sp. WD16]UTD25537.1 hypothetical protein DB459_00080 [Bradyrhizobium sp. WD16]
MADNHERGEALLVRIRRLTTLAAAPELATDPARVLALLDDIETVRQGLLRECGHLDDQMRQAMTTMTALTAYARSASAAGGRPRHRH